MPQRIALWIYWQAVRLLAKGVPFYGPPDKRYQQRAAETAANPAMPNGARFKWRAAQDWPWSLG